MSDTRISKAMQENLLTLLSFYDDRCMLVRNSVDLNLFEGVYFDIARKIYSYIDDYKESPKSHLPDLFSTVLEGDNTKQRELYLKVLQQINEFSQTINIEYTMHNLETFVRHQRLKTGIFEAAKILQEGGKGAEDKAEVVLSEYMKGRLSLFDPGILLGNPVQALNFLRKQEEVGYPTGIKELDEKQLGPIRKGLHLFIAGPKSGKSWWLINLGKRAAMQRLKVCYVSLEMDEDLVSQRFIQSFFAVPKHKAKYNLTQFKWSELTGGFLGFQTVSRDSFTSLYDPDAETKLLKKVDKFGNMLNNIIIKQFPTGQLTVNQLKAFLESLEDSHKFIPDLLIVDYADLMKTNTDNYRLDLASISKDLRGLAVERNIALATASQSNREGAKRGKIRATDVAEDFSKVATADCVLTYSQTEEEKAVDLARIFVAAARGDADKFEVIVTQNYTTGQFVLESLANSVLIASELPGSVEALGMERARAEADDKPRFD